MSDRLMDGRLKNFFWHENEYIDGGHISLIGTDANAVYMCLVRHAGTDGTCFPSQTKLMAETGLTKPSIIKSVERLIWLGYITKLETGSSKGHANIYKILNIPSATSQRDLLVNVVYQSTTFTTTSKQRLLQLVNDVYSKKTHRRIPIEENTLKSAIKNLEASLGKQSKVVKGNFGGDRQNPKASLEQKKETSDSHQKPSTGSNTPAARGVRLTAKGGEPQDIVRGLIAELSGDRYEEFIKCAGDYLASTAYWKEQLALGRKITERVILQRYAKDLKFYATDDDEAIAQKIAPVSTAIQTDVEMYGLDTAIALVPSVTEITTNNLEEACRAYQNAPEILELNREEFQERYGVSQSKFTTYLFENRLI